MQNVDKICQFFQGWFIRILSAWQLWLNHKVIKIFASYLIFLYTMSIFFFRLCSFYQIQKSFLRGLHKKSSSFRISKVFPSFGLLASPGILSDSLPLPHYLSTASVCTSSKLPVLHILTPIWSYAVYRSSQRIPFSLLDLFTFFNHLILQLYPIDTVCVLFATLKVSI